MLTEQELYFSSHAPELPKCEYSPVQKCHHLVYINSLSEQRTLFGRETRLYYTIQQLTEERE